MREAFSFQAYGLQVKGTKCSHVGAVGLRPQFVHRSSRCLAWFSLKFYIYPGMNKSGLLAKWVTNGLHRAQRLFASVFCLPFFLSEAPARAGNLLASVWIPIGTGTTLRLWACLRNRTGAWEFGTLLFSLFFTASHAQAQGVRHFFSAKLQAFRTSNTMWGNITLTALFLQQL